MLYRAVTTSKLFLLELTRTRGSINNAEIFFHNFKGIPVLMKSLFTNCQILVHICDPKLSKYCHVRNKPFFLQTGSHLLLYMPIDLYIHAYRLRRTVSNTLIPAYNLINCLLTIAIFFQNYTSLFQFDLIYLHTLSEL